MATWAFIRVLDRLAVARRPTGRLAAAVTGPTRGLTVAGRAALPRPAVAGPATTAVRRPPGTAVAPIPVRGPPAVRTCSAPPRATVGGTPGRPAGGRSAGPAAIARRGSTSGRTAGPGARAVPSGAPTSARGCPCTGAVPSRRAGVARSSTPASRRTRILARRRRTASVATGCRTIRTPGRGIGTVARRCRGTAGRGPGTVARRRRTASVTARCRSTRTAAGGRARTGIAGRRRTARCGTSRAAITRRAGSAAR
jgi:hypothetical protein